MRIVSFRDAEDNLDEIVDRAVAGESQRGTVRGGDAIIILCASEYDDLVRPRDSLVEFFARSPHRDISLEHERSRDEGRAVDL